MVFVLDWDGTIVGRVDFQSYRYVLLQMLRRAGYKLTGKEAPEAFTSQSGLVRPGFASWVKAMQRHYDGNVMFFIYTASERQWALREIDWVEKAHDIKFARPIFTRKDCVLDKDNVYRKRLHNVLPRIFRGVQKFANEGRALNDVERTVLVEQQLLIIDNNSVYDDYTHRLLICPDYDYMHFENIVDGIPAHLLELPRIQTFLNALASSGMVCPPPTTQSSPPSYHGKLARTFAWMTKKCIAIDRDNVAYLADVFWKHLKKIIIQNNLHAFPTNLIARIHAKVHPKIDHILPSSFGK